MNKLRYVKRLNFNICPLLGILTVFFVIAETPSREGIGGLFLLPLTWTLCSFVFQDIIPFHKNGFGLKIFYMISCLRYLILPVITCLAGDVSSPYGYFQAGAYRYAIIIQCIELFTSCVSIKLNYEKLYYKNFNKVPNRYYSYDDISLGSLFVIIGSVGLIIIRGADRLLRSMRFGIVSETLDRDAYYGYDIWLAHTLMALIVIIVTGKFQKANDKTDSIINVIVPVMLVGLSCLFVFGNNRMMIVYFAVSGMATLFAAFPTKRKIIVAAVVPVMLAVLISFTMVKQFRADVNTSLGIEIKTIQQIFAAYLTGTESIAKTHHLYGINGKQMQVFTLFSDIVHKTTILGLPGLNKIVEIFSGIPTSYELAMYRSEIVPVAGQTLFYGGYFTGWILDIIVYYFLVKFLCYFETKAKCAQRVGDVYLYTWISTVFSMSMCYSVSVIYNGLTYVPFFLVITLLIIRYIRLRASVNKRMRFKFGTKDNQ